MAFIEIKKVFEAARKDVDSTWRAINVKQQRDRAEQKLQISNVFPMTSKVYIFFEMCSFCSALSLCCFSTSISLEMSLRARRAILSSFLDYFRLCFNPVTSKFK